MRFRIVLTLVTLFMITFLTACLSVAVSFEALASQPGNGSATERGSISGKISSVGDALFSVDVRKSEDVATLQFVIDDSTKVEGKLEVGAMATVDYRTNGTKNVALHIVVQPAKVLRSR